MRTRTRTRTSTDACRDHLFIVEDWKRVSREEKPIFSLGPVVELLYSRASKLPDPRSGMHTKPV